MIPVCPALEFPPVALSADDLLPADIVMLLVYRDLTADVAHALGAGLRAFPHLTGRVDGWPPRIIPDPGSPVVMETTASGDAFEPEDFQRIAPGRLLARFAPVAREGGLFAVRRVDFPRTGISTLCLRVSHIAVDGHGLGLFLAHASAAARSVAPPPLVHERSRLLHGDTPPSVAVPEAHIEWAIKGAPGTLSPDVLAQGEPVWFAVPMEAAGGRHAFAAWLCAETARLQPSLRRVAIWCNTRGRGAAPSTYTGNAGCYLHMDLSGDVAALAQEIRVLASRRGLERARRVHQAILRLRAAGRDIRWDGPHDDLLQLNLLSPPVEVADFGGGRPCFGLLLSRNSSGLRVFPSACVTRLVVEATLPPDVGAGLAEACARRGMAPEIWGGGFT